MRRGQMARGVCSRRGIECPKLTEVPWRLNYVILHGGEYILTIKKAAFWASGVIAALTLISTIVAQQQPRTVDAKVLRTAGTAKDTLPGTWLTYGLTQTEQCNGPQNLDTKLALS